MAVGTGIALFGANPTDVNINVEGTVKEGIRAQDIGASKIEDFTGALTQVANTTANLINAQKASEANDAKSDWVNIYNSEGYKNADDVGKAEMIEEQLGTLGDRSDSYSKAFRANIYSEYDRVYKGRQTIENNAIYNSAPNTFKLYEMETGGTAEQFVNDMSTEYPQLDKNVLKTSLLEGVYQDIYTEVESATNEGELTTALSNIEDIKASYQGDKFLQTKSKQGKELIRAAESKVQAMVKAKQAEFVTMHKTAISNAVDEGYSEHPIKLEDDFKGAYSDPLTRQSKQAQYTKKYEESTEALAYNSENPIGSNPQSYPNDMAKDRRKIVVTDTMTNLFATGQTAEFVRVGMGEKGLTKETGDMLLSVIDRSTDPAELGNVFGTIAKINETPQGATVLRQMFTDDEYTRVMKTMWVNKYRPEYTPQQSRDYIHGLSKNIARVQLEPTKKAKMFDYAAKLGRQGDKFLAIMDTFIATDATMAEDMMKDVYSFFEKQTGETTTGVKTDNSMGTVPESLDPERTDKMIDEAIPNASSISYVGDDMIVGYDEIGGVVQIVNSTPIIERSNSNYEDMMIRESMEEKGTVGQAFEGFGRTLVDNAGDFVTGVLPTLGELGGNITNAIGENIMRNLKEDIKNSPEWVQDAAGFMKKFADIEIDNPAQAEEILDDEIDNFMLEVLNLESKKLDTKMPDNIQNNTFSAQMQNLVTNGLLRNEAEKDKIDAKIIEVEEKIITKDLPEKFVEPKKEEPKREQKPLTYSTNMTDKQKKALQKKIGTTADGKFGPASKRALEAYNQELTWKDSSLEELQTKYSDDTIDWKTIGKDKYNPITGLSGTIAHRNHNPGALKMEFAGAILGKTISPSNMRSRAKALASAKKRYDGVVNLDRAGFLIFKNRDYGRAAQKRLLVNSHKGRTIEQMLPKYAIKDGSGDTHHADYAKAIYNYAGSKGYDLKGKKIGDMSNDEVNTLTMAMAKVEGGI